VEETFNRLQQVARTQLGCQVYRNFNLGNWSFHLARPTVHWIALGHFPSWNDAIIVLAHEMGHALDYLELGWSAYTYQPVMAMEIKAWRHARTLLQDQAVFPQLVPRFRAIRRYGLQHYASYYNCNPQITTGSVHHRDTLGAAAS